MLQRVDENIHVCIVLLTSKLRGRKKSDSCRQCEEREPVAYLNPFGAVLAKLFREACSRVCDRIGVLQMRAASR